VTRPHLEQNSLTVPGQDSVGRGLRIFSDNPYPIDYADGVLNALAICKFLKPVGDNGLARKVARTLSKSMNLSIERPVNFSKAQEVLASDPPRVERGTKDA
jgi:hypothetical protein